MRQPEVARLAALLLAVLLVVPVAQSGRTMLVAGAFLVEFLTQGRYAPLSGLTSPPDREPLAVPGAAVDRYVGHGSRNAAPLVLVHGVTPEGKDDPAARQAATLLARAGFDVAVPTIPGLTRGRLRLEDVEPVVTTLAARAAPTTVIGVSIGSGPALLAAADPRVRDRVSAVVSLGGYASATEVLRFWLTGAYEFGEVRGHVPHEPELVRLFIRANADLLDPAARAELEAADAGRAARVLASLSPELQRYLDSLSPMRAARDVRARLVLIHGRSDRAVPYTESLRLAAARPERTTVALVGVMDHVAGGGTAGWQDLRDFLALWRVMYALIATRGGAAAGSTVGHFAPGGRGALVADCCRASAMSFRMVSASGPSGTTFRNASAALRAAGKSRVP